MVAYPPGRDGVLPSQEDTPSAEELRQYGSRLINSRGCRNWRRAVRALQLATQLEPDNFDGWFQLALVHDLLLDYPAADLAIGRARKCSGNNPLREGDVLRDLARRAIKLGQFERASNLLDEAKRLHAGDQNRLACLLGFRGRLLTAQKRYADGLECHLRAMSIWHEIGDTADRQWVYNNLLPTLRAIMALAEQLLVQTIRAKEAKRTWQHVALGLIMFVPVLGWRVVRLLRP
jgi:tetratricopeptide (TPR) repeat protein